MTQVGFDLRTTSNPSRGTLRSKRNSSLVDWRVLQSESHNHKRSQTRETSSVKTTPHQLNHEFGRILEESLNEIFIFDAESLRFVQVNRGGRENLGYSMKELQELTPLDIKPEFNRESFEQLLTPLRNGERQTICFETVHRRKNGTIYDVEVHLQRSTCHSQPVFIAIILDTTERKQTVQLISEREARLQAILNTAVEAIITINDKGICDSLNPAAERMFGYAAEEIIGKNISLLMPAPYRDEHDTYISNYLRTRTKKIIGIGREVVGKRKDGSEFPIHLSVSEIPLGDRRLFTGIIQDISQRKEAETRLVQSERLAAVGEAMASLAHESRNLLQKIQMGVELGRMETTENPQATTQLDNIERASDSLQALLDEVRNYTSPIHLEVSDGQLPELWREAWQLLLPNRAKRQIVLREDLETTSLSCKVDRFRFVQVFRNLFENSLAACNDPVEIVIGVTESHSERGATFQITVQDNGPGLNEQQRERIFEPFYTTKSRGTGLGMAIAQRIVEAHGGHISLESEESRGAKFKIEFPQSVACSDH